MTHFWPLTFGLIGFWFAVEVVELIRTRVTPPANNTNLRRHPVAN